MSTMRPEAQNSTDLENKQTTIAKVSGTEGKSTSKKAGNKPITKAGSDAEKNSGLDFLSIIIFPVLFVSFFNA